MKFSKYISHFHVRQRVRIQQHVHVQRKLGDSAPQRRRLRIIMLHSVDLTGSIDSNQIVSAH